MMTTIPPFHIAFPVHNVDEARRFYGEVLGLPEGRCSDTWVDFDLYGHQIVAHYKPPIEERGEKNIHHNPVDGQDVPVPHFGVILTMDDWKALRDRLIAAEIQFKIEPYIRFEGEAGEQATMFFLDPSGNALEFKAFNDVSKLFEK
ncbi:MAG: VOC family protein [Arenicella sp.]|nr:VOC family protein [Arenicella sp.]